jgi:hypothetical protein
MRRNSIELQNLELQMFKDLIFYRRNGSMRQELGMTGLHALADK